MKLEKGIAYNCKKEKIANALLKRAEKDGLKWASGNKPTLINYWDEYEQQTCYIVNDDMKLEYSPIDFYKKAGYKIVEYNPRKTIWRNRNENKNND